MFYSDFYISTVKLKITYTQMHIQPYGFSSRNVLIWLCLESSFLSFLDDLPRFISGDQPHTANNYRQPWKQNLSTINCIPATQGST